MDFMSWVWQSTSISPEALLGLTGLGAFALLLLACSLRARLRRPFAIRSLRAASLVEAALAQAMETGEAMHVALGSGGLGDVSTADTLAGLSLVSHLARQGALAETPLRVQAADPTALAGALAVLQQGAVATGYPEAFDPTQAEFVAPAPLAYAAGVTEGLQQEAVAANAMVGAFGPEALLPADAGMRLGLPQTGGTSDPSVLPLFQATMDAPLLGEEIYALGAALGRADHTGSLVAQDVFRALLAFGIVLIVVLGLIGAF